MLKTILPCSIVSLCLCDSLVFPAAEIDDLERGAKRSIERLENDTKDSIARQRGRHDAKHGSLQSEVAKAREDLMKDIDEGAKGEGNVRYEQQAVECCNTCASPSLICTHSCMCVRVCLWFQKTKELEHE